VARSALVLPNRAEVLRLRAKVENRPRRPTFYLGRHRRNSGGCDESISNTGTITEGFGEPSDESSPR